MIGYRYLTGGIVIDQRHLKSIQFKPLEPNGVFFIESSWRRFITPREVCAIESASKHHSNSDIWMISMFTKQVPIHIHYERCFANKTVYWFHQNTSKYFEDSPLWEW